MWINRCKKKKQPIEVEVIYPETAEGIKELQDSQARAMLRILENQLGEDGLRRFIEYAESKAKDKPS